MTNNIVFAIFRQSLKRDKAQCDTASIDSVTKKWFKKGKISAAEVTEASKEIVQGGTNGNSSGSTDGVGKWANAGGPNEIRGNMSRDVVRSMTKKSSKPEVYSTRITFWDDEKCEKVEDDVFCLLPTETIDNLIDEGQPLSDFTSLPPDSPLRHRKAEWMKSVGAHGDGDEIVVCGLWGDSATYHTRDSLFMLLFNLLSGVYNTRFWIACWGKR